MSNPVIPWELREVDPDTLAALLNQNFFAIVDWATFNTIHAHHVWVTEAGVSALPAGGAEDITISFPAGQFGPNSRPRVISVQPFSTQVVFSDNSEQLTHSVFAETSTGAKVRVRNQGAAALGTGSVFIRVTVKDLNLDTTS